MDCPGKSDRIWKDINVMPCGLIENILNIPCTIDQGQSWGLISFYPWTLEVLENKKHLEKILDELFSL